MGRIIKPLQTKRMVGRFSPHCACQTFVICSLIALTPNLASAQNQRQKGIVIEEIVVTAQRRDEVINDVPIAISAFGGEKLDALGITDTRDLSRVVPGFTAAESGGNTPVYTLRGIGFNDQSFTATPTVGVYVDEVPLPYTIMTKGANLDLNRVEVLKGPQGTLYGRNTTGGAINYIANKPTEEFEAGLKAGYGSYQRAELEGFVSGSLSDSMRARVAAKAIKSGEGWQYSNTRRHDKMGEVDKQAFRAALDWDVGDLALSFSLSGWRDRSDAQAPQAIAIQAQNPNDVGGITLAPVIRNHPLIDKDTDDVRVADWEPNTDWGLDDSYIQIAMRGDWFLSDTTTLTWLLSHGAVESNAVLPQSGFNVYNGEQALDAEVTTDSVEVRLAGQWGGANNWMVGGNVARDSGEEFHQLYSDTTSSVYPNPLNNMSLITNRLNTQGDVDGDLLGVFFNTDWQFSDTMRLTVGGRYSKETREFSGCTSDDADSDGVGTGSIVTVVAATRGSVTLIDKGECFTIDEVGSNEKFHGENTEDNISYRVALDWTPEEGLLFYLSYGQGYKSGGYAVLNASDQAQYEPVAQEKLLALELGGKMTLADNKAQIDFAVFDYDYSDKQLLTRILDPIFGPVPVLRNAPKSKVEGAELALQLTPITGLFISTATSYIETEIEEFSGTGFDGSIVNFAGKDFNFAPVLQYTLLADYSWDLGDKYAMGVGIDYSYTDETNSTLEGNANYAHDDYGITNARIRLEPQLGDWKLSFWGRNITDEFSTVSVFNIGDAVARYTGQPRTWGASIEYNFY